MIRWPHHAQWLSTAGIVHAPRRRRKSDTKETAPLVPCAGRDRKPEHEVPRIEATFELGPS